MYSLLTEFRDGDNVTTMLEHNSNFVPWHALCHEILPRLGRRVECQLARFDPATGRLDPDHPASLVDARTRLVCCTGASNFFGTKPDLVAVRQIARAKGALFLVDGAQLLPSSAVDVQALDVDCLAFSVHKLLGPSASVPCTPKSTCCEMHDLSTARGRVEITHHTPDPISVPMRAGPDRTQRPPRHDSSPGYTGIDIVLADSCLTLHE
jgi:selenocysteine lyase/cysteine desulfurase